MTATLSNIWQRMMALPTRVKVIVGGVAIASVVVMVLVVRAATVTEWQPVVEGVDPREIGEMQAALDDAEITHQEADQGTTLLVRSQDFGEARIALAPTGALAGSGNHYTYEDLLKEGNERKLGMTEQEWQFQITRSLEGMIATDIERIEGVNGATVRLAVPEEALFAEEQSKRTASVTVDTGGEGLAAEQVKSIQQLVAHAVEDMSARDVVIIDEDGRTLTEDGADGMTGETAARKVQERYNLQQESRLMSSLERIAGEGNVTALMTTNLDLDAVQRQIRDVGGEANAQGPLEKETVKTEDLEVDGGTAAGGVTGLGPALVGAANGANNQFAATQPGTGADTDYANGDVTRTYSNDEVTEVITEAPGLVDNMSLAVVANEELPAETLAALDNVARTFLGQAQNPGENTYSMTTAPLPQPRNLEAEALTQARRDAIIGYAKWLLLGLGVIFIAAVMRRQLADRTVELLESENRMLALDPGFDPVPLADLESALAQQQLLSNERLALQRKVERIANEEPEEAALLVRSWLHDR